MTCITPSASFVRPGNATQYAAGDLVSNAVGDPLEFDISRLGFASGIIAHARLYKSGATVTLATFALDLFSQKPLSTVGDNGVYNVTTAEHFLGTIACDMSTGAFTTATTGIAKRFPAVFGSLPDMLVYELERDKYKNYKLYGFLRATAAYTPGSGEIFKVWLEIGDDCSGSRELPRSFTL